MKPKIFKTNYAYVASTLPARLLNNKASEWNISTILVASPALGRSYEYLRKKNPSLKILVLPKKTLLNIFYLAVFLFLIKICKRKIYFFHEWSCINFDLLIGIIKPSGCFYPQVSLSSLERINFQLVKSCKIKLCLCLFGLKDKFVPYLMDRDDQVSQVVAWSRTNYPSTVTCYDLIDSKNIYMTGIEYRKKSSSGRLLFLVGAEVFDNDIVRQVFIDIVNICIDLGFVCCVKDHPRPKSRLLLVHPQLFEVDPDMPIELSDDVYDFVIGVASTGLLYFKDRAISILYLIKNSDGSLLERRKRHLIELEFGDLVNFPSSFEELIALLNTKLPSH